MKQKLFLLLTVVAITFSACKKADSKEEQPVNDSIEMTSEVPEGHTSNIAVDWEGEHYVVEARIQIPFGKLFAEAEHSDLYAAINALEQKLERQIIRHIHRPDARRNRQVQRQSSMAAMF
jgi:ribosomal subunit interface protein